MPPPTSPRVVRMPLERNVDKQLELCRFGAQRDHMIVVLEREVTNASGHVVRREPVVEITETGDVREVAPRGLRVSLMDRLTHDAWFTPATHNATGGHHVREALRGAKRARAAVEEWRRLKTAGPRPLPPTRVA